MSKTFKALERAERERRIGTPSPTDAQESGPAPSTLVPLSVPGPAYIRQAIAFERSALGRCRTEKPAVVIYSLDPATPATGWAASCAASLSARQHRKILLADASLNAPTLNRVCNIPPSPGILDIMAGREPKVHHVPLIDSEEFVDIVTLDEKVPPEDRKSGIEKLGEWVSRQRSRYEWIWLTAGGPEDSAMLSGLYPWCDGVLVLVSGKTKPAKAERFCKNLLKEGTRILGTVYLEKE